jgi:type IV pilus assembly protein PilO
MNLSEINWDLEAAGQWPTPIKAGAIGLVALLVAVFGVYMVTLPQLDELDVLEKEEANLKIAFEGKQKKAVNLQDYREQFNQIESSLGEMLKQMPTKAEVASLLVDISQTGLSSGLEFKLFQPSQEVRKDFYSELPISIQVVGKYEELGLFVSGLAALPRIVTVHDVTLMPLAKDSKDNKGSMNMTAIIKTYNEGLSEDAAQAAKKRRGP